MHWFALLERLRFANDVFPGHSAQRGSYGRWADAVSFSKGRISHCQTHPQCYSTLHLLYQVLNTLSRLQVIVTMSLSVWYSQMTEWRSMSPAVLVRAKKPHKATFMYQPLQMYWLKRFLIITVYKKKVSCWNNGMLIKKLETQLN